MENKALEAWRATFGAAAYNYWNRIDKFINVSPDMEQMPDEVYNSLEVQKVVSEYPSVSSHAIRRVVGHRRVELVGALSGGFGPDLLLFSYCGGGGRSAECEAQGWKPVSRWDW